MRKQFGTISLIKVLMSEVERHCEKNSVRVFTWPSRDIGSYGFTKGIGLQSGYNIGAGHMVGDAKLSNLFVPFSQMTRNHLKTIRVIK